MRFVSKKKGHNPVSKPAMKNKWHFLNQNSGEQG